MGLASNATGRLHTPALKKLQEVISQQNGRKCSSFPYNIRVQLTGAVMGTKPLLVLDCTHYVPHRRS